MVTATPTRTPHALQSGPRTGFLWVLHAALPVAIQCLVLLFLPEAGRHLAWNDGVLTPDMTLVLGTFVALAVMIASAVIGGVIRRFLTMHLPGHLLNDGPPTVMAPDLVSAVLGNTVVALAAFYAATHSVGDYGLTKMMLVGLGVGMLAMLPGRLLSTWGHGSSGRRKGMVITGVDLVMSGVVLLLASASASDGILHSALRDFFGLGFLAVVVAVMSLFFGLAPVMDKRAKARRAGEESPKDPLRALSDRIVDTKIASPTLRHYKTAHRLALTLVGVTGVLFILLSLVVNVVLP